MSVRKKVIAACCTCALGVAGVALAAEPAKASHSVPKSKDGNLVVGLCDGETSMEVQGVKDGQALSRDKAQSVSDALMAEWRRKNPNAQWEEAPILAHASNKGRTPLEATQETLAGQPTYKAPGVLGAPTSGASKQSGHTYGAFGARDEQIWKASTQQFIDRGHKVFHDAKELGGTVGISCDMCHPDGSNTHPETYPKFQVQLGRVALLRDMINWCIENPVRGKPLADNDERLRAMEAYIYARRKGTALEYGKH